MNVHSFIKNKVLNTIFNRNLSTSTEYQKSIQVCIFGANTSLGHYTSFLMKQSPIISVLRMHGDHSVLGLAADLEKIDTKCKLKAFEGINGVSKAVRGADIVLMLGDAGLKEDTSLADRIIAEGRRVFDLARECTNFAPRSIMVVNVSPVSVFAVLVAEVFKGTSWYHPGRIIGSAALAQIKANCVYGRGQDLDPHMCQVPIVGGPDIDLAVPLFSKAKPVELNDRTSIKLVAKFRGVKDDEFPRVLGKPDFVENCSHSEAFALNHMIHMIGLGLCGDQGAYCNAFVRSNLIDTCQHLVTTLQFSRGGVVHNCGIPQLSRLELKMFEKALLEIKQREDMAKEFVKGIMKGDPKTPSFKVKEMEKRKMLQQNVIS